jgi:hypothetical protein
MCRRLCGISEAGDYRAPYLCRRMNLPLGSAIPNEQTAAISFEANRTPDLLRLDVVVHQHPLPLRSMASIRRLVLILASPGRCVALLEEQ